MQQQRRPRRSHAEPAAHPAGWQLVTGMQTSTVPSSNTFKQPKPSVEQTSNDTRWHVALSTLKHHATAGAGAAPPAPGAAVRALPPHLAAHPHQPPARLPLWRQQPGVRAVPKAPRHSHRPRCRPAALPVRCVGREAGKQFSRQQHSMHGRQQRQFIRQRLAESCTMPPSRLNACQRVVSTV